MSDQQDELEDGADVTQAGEAAPETEHDLPDDDDVLPEAAPSASTRVSRAARRRLARRRTIAGVIVGAVVLAGVGTGVAYASTRPMPLDKRYVTVAATIGDLTQTLSFTGTTARSNTVTASFPAAGKVTKVYVSVGETVTAGQALAKMNTTALKQAVDTAQANLDQAKLTLKQLTTTTSSSASRSSSSSSKSSSSGKKPGGGKQPVNPAALAKLVAAAQAALNAALIQAQQAQQNEDTDCAVLRPAPVPGPTPTPTPTDPITITADQAQKCTTDMDQLKAANQAVAQASGQLSNLSSQLIKAIIQVQAQCQATVQKAVKQAMSQAAQSMASQYTGGQASASETQKVAAQIEVDNAQDALRQAKTDLANATLRAPIDGIVASIPFKVGNTMSTTDAITLLGDGGVNVALSVAVSQIDQIEVGQTATIEELGVGKATGTVSLKDLAPASAGGSTYSVTVAASGADAQALLDGVTAQVTITVGQITGAVLVPVSAVTLGDTNQSGTVTKLGSDGIQIVDVQIAAIGATSVAISQGVSVGDRLVVADTTSAMPTNLNGLGRALGGGGGGGGTRVYVNGNGGGYSGGGQQPPG